jgi:hypothetical protein
MKAFWLKAPLALTATAISIIFCGCLEHEENITVAPTGNTTIEVKLSGTPQSLRDSVLLPSGPEWRIVDRQLDSADHEPTLTIEAVATVPSGSPLPASFVPPTSPDYDLSLHFPGQVTMRTEGTRIYYTFRRNYEARRFGMYDFSEIPSLWDHDLEARVLDTGLLNASPKDRQQYLEQLSAGYGYRYWRFFCEGVAALVRSRAITDTSMPLLEAEAEQYLEATLTPQFVFGVMQRDEAQIQATIDSLGQVIDDHFRQMMSREAQVNSAALASYDRAYVRAQRDYDVTQKLDGFQYTINLVMPGVIIGTNGVLDAKAPNKVLWCFKGSKLNDADVPLYAVSVVTR